MSKFVRREKILSKQQIKQLLNIKKKFDPMPASVYDKGGLVSSGGVDRNIRDTNKYPITHKDYPKICKTYESYLEENYDHGHNITQFDYLDYGKGQFFMMHTDSQHHRQELGDNSNVSGRIWSSSTLLEQSKDLQGGDLLIYGPKPNNYPMKIQLEVGETVWFPSHFFHEVTPVTKGKRTVLVVWAGETEDEIKKRHSVAATMARGNTSIL
jgi:hypothetical protein